MDEQAAAVLIFMRETQAVLDLLFTLANRENDDPLVLDARSLIDQIEALQGV